MKDAALVSGLTFAFSTFAPRDGLGAAVTNKLAETRRHAGRCPCLAEVADRFAEEMEYVVAYTPTVGGPTYKTTVLQRTTTDKEGHWSLLVPPERRIHNIRFMKYAFHQLRFRVSLTHRVAKPLDFVLPVS